METLKAIVETSKHLQMKEAEDKNALFSFRLTLCLSPLHLDLFKLRPPIIGEDDIMNFTLFFPLSLSFILSANLIPTTQQDDESQQKSKGRPQHSSTNSGISSNGSNHGQYPTTCYRASLIF